MHALFAGSGRGRLSGPCRRPVQVHGPASRPFPVRLCMAERPGPEPGGKGVRAPGHPSAESLAQHELGRIPATRLRPRQGPLEKQPEPVSGRIVPPWPVLHNARGHIRTARRQGISRRLFPGALQLQGFPPQRTLPAQGSRIRRIPLPVPHRLDPRRGRLFGSQLFSGGRQHPAVRPVRPRPGRGHGPCPGPRNFPGSPISGWNAPGRAATRPLSTPCSTLRAFPGRTDSPSRRANRSS